MKQFQGKTRTLPFSITIGSARRVKSLLGVDLLKPASEHEGQPLINALFVDISLFVDVLYVLCVEDRATCSDEEFANELPDAWQECRDAFFEEWIDFFRRAQLSDRAVGILKQLEALNAAMDETWTRLKETDVSGPVRESIRKFDLNVEVREALDPSPAKNPQPIPGSRSTDSPASSESSPMF